MAKICLELWGGVIIMAVEREGNIRLMIFDVRFEKMKMNGHISDYKTKSYMEWCLTPLVLSLFYHIRL
jgi:hypothetical protein